MFKGYEDVTTLKTDKQPLTIKFVMKVWYELADSSFCKLGKHDGVRKCNTLNDDSDNRI